MIRLDLGKILTARLNLTDPTRVGMLVSLLKTDDSGFEDYRDLLCSIHYLRTELTEEEYNHPAIMRLFKDLQVMKRNEIQGIIDHQAKVLLEHTLAKNKQMFAQSEHGSVEEIAKRYGISKGEVRKMRREGTLDEFIKSKIV